MAGFQALSLKKYYKKTSGTSVQSVALWCPPVSTASVLTVAQQPGQLLEKTPAPQEHKKHPSSLP